MKNCGWIVSSWATALLLGLPVLALIFSAFSADGDLFRHLADTVLLDYLANTLGLVVGVVLLSLLFGVPTAWLVAMCQVPGHRAMQWALMLPMAMPSYIVAYVYTDLLDYSGPLQAGLRTLFEWSRPADYWFPAIRSLGGAAWVLALVLFPYVYLLARASFLEQSVSLIHSSRLLGCTPWQSFRRLSLPLARPAIMVAVSLVAMETLADFATVHFFAINTLTTAVYDTWLGYGSLATAAKLSCMMLLAVVLLIALERRSRQRQQVFQKSMGHEQPLRYPLKGMSRILAGLWCWGLVLAGFGLPFVILLDYGVRYFELSWTPEFVRFAGNSLLISALTALLAMAIALLLGFFRRLDGGVKSLLPLRIAAMGYAMPGTVLAIGVLVPLTALDFGINDLAEWLGGAGAWLAADRYPHCHRIRLSGALRGHCHRFGGEQHGQDLPQPRHGGPFPGTGRWRYAAAGSSAAGATGSVCRCHAGIHRIHEGAARRPAAAAVQLRYPGDPRLSICLGRDAGARRPGGHRYRAGRAVAAYLGQPQPG